MKIIAQIKSVGVKWSDFDGTKKAIFTLETNEEGAKELINIPKQTGLKIDIKFVQPQLTNHNKNMEMDKLELN